MKLNEAKKLMEQVLAEEWAAFNFKEITVTTAITYQNADGDECDENDKSLRFIAVILGRLVCFF